jgi:glycosyltransferase involved in cell wall biosynthesis
MNILQVNTDDGAGGAAQIARNLLQACQSRGHDSRLAVSQKTSRDSRVLEIPISRLAPPSVRLCWHLHRKLAPMETWTRGFWHIRKWIYSAASRKPTNDGWEAALPESRTLLELPPNKPHIVHCHNLHSGYFNMRVLPSLSRQVPVFMTLHDAWLLSGHCAHSFDCHKWQTGCGFCPDLTIPPAIPRDTTAENWQYKRVLYSASRLYVATPSQWLMDRVRQSMLYPGCEEARVIPNGVDLSVFQPSDQQLARARLGLPPEASILLFAANGIRQNIWKDFASMRDALACIAGGDSGRSILFIALGEDAPSEQIGHAELRFVPYQRDPKTVARFYQAADVYIHAAKADTFPSTVLEALACGTPVVATAVGGIVEQVQEGRTGFLTPPGDGTSLADRIARLLTDATLRQRMGRNAVTMAQRRFDLSRQIDEYLSWYSEIKDSFQLLSKGITMET